MGKLQMAYDVKELVDKILSENPKDNLKLLQIKIPYEVPTPTGVIKKGVIPEKIINLLSKRLDEGTKLKNKRQREKYKKIRQIKNFIRFNYPPCCRDCGGCTRWKKYKFKKNKEGYFEGDINCLFFTCLDEHCLGARYSHCYICDEKDIERY